MDRRLLEISSGCVTFGPGMLSLDLHSPPCAGSTRWATKARQRSSLGFPYARQMGLLGTVRMTSKPITDSIWRMHFSVKIHHTRSTWLSVVGAKHATASLPL